MEAISNIILKGLLNDLIICERSHSLNKLIKKTFNQITDPIKADVSKIMDDLTYTEMVLGLCRIYDSPHKNYPTRCLKQLYNLVKSVNYNVEVKNKAYLKTKLHFFDIYPNYLPLLENDKITEFNESVITFFETTESNEPISSSMDTIKKIRDKLLAHNEEITLSSFISYDSRQVLIDHAKNVISCFALAYCEINLKPFNNFYLGHDALDWNIIYERFINQKNGG